MVWSFSFRFLPFLFAFAVGGLGFELCVFVSGGMLLGVSGILVLLILGDVNEGCEGHGSANRLPQPRMELAERSREHTYVGRNC